MRISNKALCMMAVLLFGCTPSPDASTSNKKPDNLQLIVLLSERNFPELERRLAMMHHQYQSGKMLDTELYEFFKKFTDRDLSIEPDFIAWSEQYPKSYIAKTSLGIYYENAAWRERGDKYRKETKEVQIQRFKDYLKKSDAALRSSIPLDLHPCLSYTNLIVVSCVLSNGLERKYLDAALQCDPGSVSARKDYLIFTSPKWGGNIESMNRFLAEIKASGLDDKNKRYLESIYFKLLGELARVAEHYNESIILYRKAFQVYPEDSDNLYTAGMTAMDGGLWDSALDVFTQLIQKDPTNMYARNKRGFLYETKYSNKGKAFDDFMVSADNGNDWAQNRIGWWYMTGYYVKKNYVKATFYLTKAAAQGNENAKENLKNMLAELIGI